MKAKKIVPIIAGGILGTGVAVLTYRKIQRLQKMVSAGNGLIKTQDELIESLKAASENKDDQIDALNKIIDQKNEVIALQKEMLALHEEEASVQNNSQEPSEDPKPAQWSLPLDAPVDGREYVFQYDIDFNLIGKYKSIKSACKSVGIKYAGSIGKVLNGTNLVAAGYFWSKGTSPVKDIPDEWKAAANAIKDDE